MTRLACAIALLAASPAALAQPGASSDGSISPVLATVSLGNANDGRGLSFSAGPNLGQVSPQVFGAVSAGGEQSRLSYRATAGVVARLSIDPPGGRLDVATLVGAGYALTRASSPLLLPDGRQGRTLSRDGAVVVLGAEATGWLTRSVGVSLMAHQNVALFNMSKVNSEQFRASGPDEEPSFGIVTAPALDQWGVSVGLRFGRQRR